jgi:hypothetical protein
LKNLVGKSNLSTGKLLNNTCISLFIRDLFLFMMSCFSNHNEFCVFLLIQTLMRSTDPALQSHSDTSHLMPETDDVAFWDMSAGGNFSSSIVLTAGDDEDMRKFHPIGTIPVIVGMILLVVCTCLRLIG